MKSDVSETVNFMESYFFVGKQRRWIYSINNSPIEIWGEYLAPHNYNNADFTYEYHLKHGKGIGVCEDEATLVDALLKSVGISTLLTQTYWVEKGWYGGHTHIIYYLL